MKSNKGLKAYILIWVILLAAFNVICFVTPAADSAAGKYTAQFWIGYAFITATFIGQLICSIMALKGDTAAKLFYSIPLIRISYTGLILTLIFGGAFMAIPKVPNWIGIILCTLVLAFTAIAVVKAGTAAAAVETVDQKVKTQTAFIRLLTADADSLMSRAGTDSAKAACSKVYEAVRYSDPMSDAALSDAENRITEAFNRLSDAVKDGDDDRIAALADEVVGLVGERNSRCKLLK